MNTDWDEARLLAYIADGIEESQTLEYKAADSLGRTNNLKDEITKDVSAMANAAGGVLIYGIREYREPNKKHLPEKLDPINRQEFSREWLEQVIGNIQPRISEVIISPVTLSSAPNHAAYVIEIPQGATAHQATSLRYYRRYNFEVVPMKDYEIRDVMNRLTLPDVEVEFAYRKLSIESHEHKYGLTIVIKNLGPQMVNHFQLHFTFPDYGHFLVFPANQPNIYSWRESHREFMFRYRSNMVLFPEEEREISQELVIQYRVDGQIYASFTHSPSTVSVQWKLNADNMPTKTGSIPFEKLQCF